MMMRKKNQDRVVLREKNEWTIKYHEIYDAIQGGRAEVCSFFSSM